MQLTGLKVGEKAVVTSFKLGLIAQKQLLTFGVGLGSIIKREFSPGFSALVRININGKSLCIRNRDARLIEVIKYEE